MLFSIAPKTMDGETVTSWNEYDPIGASFRCMDNAIVVPVIYDKWQTIFTKKGKSSSFSQGGFVNFTVGVALGMGLDSGHAPYDVSFDNSIDEDWSMALAYYRSQSSLERERLNLVKLWDDASTKRNQLAGVVSGVSFFAQGASGTQAFNSREITIIVQEHKGVPRLYRAIIEAFSLWREIRTGNIYASSTFVSFNSGRWQEHAFYNKRVR